MAEAACATGPARGPHPHRHQLDRRRGHRRRARHHRVDEVHGRRVDLDPGDGADRGAVPADQPPLRHRGVAAPAARGAAARAGKPCDPPGPGGEHGDGSMVLR